MICIVLFFFDFAKIANPATLSISLDNFAHRMRKFFTITVFLLAIPAMHLAAQELPPALKLAPLPAASGDTIGREKLRTETGIADAIRSFSGVQIKDFGGLGGLKTVNVRSMGSEYTGVFIDGLQVGNAQNMQVDLGRFSTDGLDAVILYNGQKDGRLQSAKEYASGATVYLVSATPSFEEDKVRNMSARVRSGAFGTFEPTIEYERKLSDKNSLRLIGDYLYADGRYHFRKFDSTMVRQNTDLRSFRVEGSFYHRGSSYWNLRAWYYDSKRGLPGPVIRRLKVTTADRQMDKDAFLQGKWSKRYGDLGNWGSEGSAAGKYSFYYTRYRTDPFKDPGALPIDNTYRQHDAYGAYSHLFSNGKCSIGLAHDAEFSYLDANLRDFAWPKRLSTWDAVSFAVADERLSMSLNLLYTFAADWFSNNKGGFKKDSEIRSFFTPSLTCRFSPDAHWTFSGFVKKTCRMPSFNDLYYTLVGNSSLEPEKAWQFDLGAVRRDNLGEVISEAKIDAYFYMVSDKIVAVPTSNQFRWSMYNIGQTRIFGIEPTWRLSGSAVVEWGLLFKYAFQRAMDFTDRESITWKGQIPYIPKHSGTISMNVSWHGWRADAAWMVTGRRWSSSANLTDYEIDAWNTLDLRLSKTFRNITCRLNVNNITDTHYEIVLNYPMPGANVIASIEYSF